MVICNSIKNCPQNWASSQKLKNFIVWLFIGMKLLPILLKYRYGLPMINRLPMHSLAYAQDIGPFPPKDLFVFFANGDRVFVVSTEAQSNIDQIAECKDVWDGFKKKSDAAFAAYQASELKEQKASDDMVRYEEEGFRAYCRCFEQRAKMEPFFKQLTEQAQTLVDNLQKQLPR